MLLDERRRWVSVAHAREAYGVVIRDGAVNHAETAALRVERIGKATDGFYDCGTERTAFEAVWNQANHAALTEGLARLPVHWRFFARHRVFETMERMDPQKRGVDGSDIHRVLAALQTEFPQLADAAD